MLDLGIESARQKWEAVEQIPYGRHITETKEELLEVIERPLRPAISAFFDRNVETIVSSCNYTDYAKGKAYIALGYDSLSEGNKEIVDGYATHELFDMPGGYTMVGMFFPIGERDTPAVIGERALALAESFSVQHTLWTSGWNLDQERQLLGGHGGRVPSREEVSDEQLMELLIAKGRYYDPTTGLFFMNKIHHQRATQTA
jgi:hypothetical protein